MVKIVGDSVRSKRERWRAEGVLWQEDCPECHDSQLKRSRWENTEKEYLGKTRIPKCRGKAQEAPDLCLRGEIEFRSRNLLQIVRTLDLGETSVWNLSKSENIQPCCLLSV